MIEVFCLISYRLLVYLKIMMIYLQNLIVSTRGFKH